MDAIAGKVVQIDFPPVWKKEEDGNLKLSVPTTAPYPLSEDSFPTANRERIPVPRTSFDFLPDLLEKNDPTYKLRDDVKPLSVIQPEGVSFKMDGNVLEWQKWKMHIGLYLISYGCQTTDDHSSIQPTRGHRHFNCYLQRQRRDPSYLLPHVIGGNGRTLWCSGTPSH